MDIEINDDNYAELRDRLDKYEMDKSLNQSLDKNLSLWDDILKNFIGLYCFDEEILNISIMDYLSFEYCLDDNGVRDIFMETNMTIPIKLKIETESRSFEFSVCDYNKIDDEVNLVLNNETNRSNFKSYLNKVNKVDKNQLIVLVNKISYALFNKHHHPSYINDRFKNLIFNNLKSTNKVKYKSELEKELDRYNKSPTIENYEIVKPKMAKFLKEHFFSNLKGNKVNRCLNKKPNYLNVAQDYALYNYLRGLPIDRGLDSVKEITLRSRRMSYSHITTLDDIIKEVYGSSGFIEKAKSEISNKGVYVKSKCYDLF